MSQASSGILEDSVTLPPHVIYYNSPDSSVNISKDFEMETEFTTKDNNNTENNDDSDAPLITDLTDEFILFNQDILRKAANDKSRLEELAKQSSKKRNEDHRSLSHARDQCAVGKYECHQKIVRHTILQESSVFTRNRTKK
ncbi:hypothetical protein CEXT_70871 [Caerostris extrusa]|uniref:Uncharacterized protein n=1 Tax=Caerostris extrusa TaxID=172846 RepID=A0AAV4RJQ2_CAEEX|nr:hypothetical protein CEXT_70871 [Caerostris extrusa]